MPLRLSLTPLEADYWARVLSSAAVKEERARDLLNMANDERMRAVGMIAKAHGKDAAEWPDGVKVTNEVEGDVRVLHIALPGDES